MMNIYLSSKCQKQWNVMAHFSVCCCCSLYYLFAFVTFCMYIIWDQLIINQYYTMILTDHVVIINIIRQFLDTFINQNTWLIGWQFTAITTSKYYKIELNLTLNDVLVYIKNIITTWNLLNWDPANSEQLASLARPDHNAHNIARTAGAF